MVSRRHLKAEAWVRFQIGPCEICGGQSDTGTGFSPSTSGFPCQYHSTNAPYPSIHLPLTLYNVSLPVLQFSPVSTIPPMLHTHPFTHHPRYIMFLSQYFSFPLSVPFHQCSVLIRMSIPVLSEGQAGEAFRYRGSLRRKVFHCFNQTLRTLKRCPSHNHKRTLFTFIDFIFPYFDKHRLAGHSRYRLQGHTHTHTHTTQIMRACLPSRVLRSLQCTELGPGNAKTC